MSMKTKITFGAWLLMLLINFGILYAVYHFLEFEVSLLFAFAYIVTQVQIIKTEIRNRL